MNLTAFALGGCAAFDFDHMNDAYDTVREKVSAIFREFAGDRVKMLKGDRLPEEITSRITNALIEPGASGPEILKADEIAFHLTDWNSDAAFLVALHLFAERFTPDEIAAGIDLFLVHVPAHVIAAARLNGNSTADIFAEGN